MQAWWLGKPQVNPDLMIDTPFFAEVDIWGNDPVPYHTPIWCISSNFWGSFIKISSLHWSLHTKNQDHLSCSTVRSFLLPSFSAFPPPLDLVLKELWYFRSWGVFKITLSVVTCSAVYIYTHDLVQRDASDLDVAAGSPQIVSSLSNLLLEARSSINGGTTSTNGS